MGRPSSFVHRHRKPWHLLSSRLHEKLVLLYLWQKPKHMMISKILELLTKHVLFWHQHFVRLTRRKMVAARYSDHADRTGVPYLFGKCSLGHISGKYSLGHISGKYSLGRIYGKHKWYAFLKNISRCALVYNMFNIIHNT